MILTCPACSTRYLVNPTSIGSEGRMVRCAKCGHTWMQSPPQDMPKTVEAEAPASAEARPIPPGSNLPAFPRRRRRRAGTAAGWAALVVVVAGAVGAAGLYREQIVALWPPAARLYAQLGVERAAPGAGLELRNISLTRGEEADTAVLVIEGQVVNPTGDVLEVPVLRGALVAADRRELRHWTFTTRQRRLLPGEVADFRTELRDPETGATDISITFDTSGEEAGKGTGSAPDAPGPEMDTLPAGEG